MFICQECSKGAEIRPSKRHSINVIIGKETNKTYSPLSVGSISGISRKTVL